MLRFWRNYDFTRAAGFMLHGGWRLRGHVLVVGGYAIALLWRVPTPPLPPDGARAEAL